MRALPAPALAVRQAGGDVNIPARCAVKCGRSAQSRIRGCIFLPYGTRSRAQKNLHRRAFGASLTSLSRFLKMARSFFESRMEELHASIIAVLRWDFSILVGAGGEPNQAIAIDCYIIFNIFFVCLTATPVFERLNATAALCQYCIYFVILRESETFLKTKKHC